MWSKLCFRLFVLIVLLQETAVAANHRLLLGNLQRLQKYLVANSDRYYAEQKALANENIFAIEQDIQAILAGKDPDILNLKFYFPYLDGDVKREYEKELGLPDRPAGSHRNVFLSLPPDETISEELFVDDKSSFLNLLKINTEILIHSAFWDEESFVKLISALEATAPQYKVRGSEVDVAVVAWLLAAPYYMRYNITDKKAEAIRFRFYELARVLSLKSSVVASVRGDEVENPLRLPLIMASAILSSNSKNIGSTIEFLVKANIPAEAITRAIVAAFQTFGKSQINLFTHDDTKLVGALLEVIAQKKIAGRDTRDLLFFLAEEVKHFHRTQMRYAQLIDVPGMEVRLELLASRAEELAVKTPAANLVSGIFNWCMQNNNRFLRMREEYCGSSLSCDISTRFNIGRITISELKHRTRNRSNNGPEDMGVSP